MYTYLCRGGICVTYQSLAPTEDCRPIRDIAYEQLKHAIITGEIPAGSRIVETAYAEKLHISRSFPGTGDLYGAVLIGSLLQGNALSAAADNAAEFVSLAIQGTPYTQDTRFGVWFEPLLPRLCPLREEPEGIL